MSLGESVSHGSWIPRFLLLWMDAILHHFAMNVSHCSLVFTSILPGSVRCRISSTHSMALGPSGSHGPQPSPGFPGARGSRGSPRRVRQGRGAQRPRAAAGAPRELLRLGASERGEVRWSGRPGPRGPPRGDSIAIVFLEQDQFRGAPLNIGPSKDGISSCKR